MSTHCCEYKKRHVEAVAAAREGRERREARCKRLDECIVCEGGGSLIGVMGSRECSSCNGTGKYKQAYGGRSSAR